MISKWIRDEKGRKRGYIVAGVVWTPDKTDLLVNVDYSYCATQDSFDAEFAKNLAIERVIKSAYRKKRIKANIHPEVFDDYAYMVNRALNYYKGGNPSPKVALFLERMKNAEVVQNEDN